MARRWDTYITRVFEEFDGKKKAASGAGALVGVFLGGPVGAAIGVGAGAGFFGYCMYKAWPAKLTEATSLVGQKLSLSKLNDLNPAPRRVGSVGVSHAGKTTLNSHISSKSAPKNERTEEVHARISVLPLNPPTVYALIDGAGQQYSQQFSIFDEVEFLIICMDHNASDTLSVIDFARLTEQENFIMQLLGNMRRTGKHPSRVHFLLNKRDRWANDEKAHELRSWFSQIIIKWQNIPNLNLTHDEHSNFDAQDIVKVVGLISSWIGK